MRISTGMIFDAGVSSMNKQTASLLHLQQQVASGRRILTPSDDPVSAARALEVTQSKDITAQFKQNHDNATSSLGLEETQLTSAGDLLMRVRELAVQAGNTTLTNSDRLSITSELRARFEELTGIANATDGSGQYLFSGFMGSTIPFGGTVASIVAGNEMSYQGDDGQRKLQVSPTRFLGVSDSGNDVFKRIVNGNGSFVTSYAVSGAGVSTNTGTGVINAGSIINTTGAAVNVATPYTAAVTAATTAAALGTTVEGLASTAAAVLVPLATATDVYNAVNVPGTPASIIAAANAEMTRVGLPLPDAASVLAAVQAESALSVSAAVAAAPAPVVVAANAEATRVTLPLPDAASVLAAIQTAVTAATTATPYAAVQTAATTKAAAYAPSLDAATTAAAGGANAAAVQAAVAALGPPSIELTAAIAAATTAAAVPGATGSDVAAAVSNQATADVSAVVPAVPASVKTAATSAAAAATAAVTAAATAAGTLGATAATVLAAMPALPPSLRAEATAAASASGATAASVAAAVSAAGPDVVTAAVTTAITATTGSTWSLRSANNFSVVFSSDATAVPPVTYYDIINTDPASPYQGNSMLTGATPVVPPTATTGQRVYQSGQPIVLNNLIMDVASEPASFGLGASVTITGTPASGDSFSLAPSSSQSIFSTIGKLIGALEGATTGAGSTNATLSNDIGFALTNLDHATDNILRVRAQIGSRMNEIDSLSSVNSDLNLQYQQTLSNLQDLDYAKAISDLTRKQTDLQAAQQSFAKVSQLSLFNYL